MSKVKSAMGKIYVGDPCYAMSEETYNLLLKELYKDDSRETYTINGHEIFNFSTEYGDGTYEGTNGMCFSVDSGMLAAIPMELCDPEQLKTLGDLGHLLDVSELGMSVENGYFMWNGITTSTIFTSIHVWKMKMKMRIYGGIYNSSHFFDVFISK